MRHLTTLAELSSLEIEHIYQISTDLKAKFSQGLREPLLPGRVMALLFEKPSLRTRVSFETAMMHLGGGTLFLGSDAGFGSRESIPDFVRVLSQYVDCIVARVYKHETIVELAKYSTCSVINGLSDVSHPCQALADLFTLRERFGSLAGRTLAYLGDANNVARSLAFCCGRLGMRFHLAAPEGYRFSQKYLDFLARECPGIEVEMEADPIKAVRGAAAVYTDVWASMGQESEAAARKQVFKDYQVDCDVMKAAGPQAYFMHCLPAHRGEEVTDAVMDSPQSIVVEQAGNRMHVQKGLLAWLLASQGGR